MAQEGTARFSSSLKVVHWLVAIIVLMLLTGFFLQDWPKAYQPTVYTLHKSFGLTVLALMLCRIFFILRSNRPPLPAVTPKWERIFSRAVQHSFYLFLILMPLSGWLMSTASNKAPVYFGLIKVPFPGIPLNEALATWMNQTHKTLAWVILILVFLHISGALKHHFINKDDVLRKMLPED